MYTKNQLQDHNLFEMKMISRIFPNLKIEFTTFQPYAPIMEMGAKITDKTGDIHLGKKFDYFAIENLMKIERTPAFIMFMHWYQRLTIFTQNAAHETVAQYIRKEDPEYAEKYGSDISQTMDEISANDLLLNYLNWKWEDTMKKTEIKLTPLACKTPSEAVERAVRPSKWAYYMYIAKAVAARSTCLRRQYGAVVVKKDEIIATGYNGSARGEENCCDKGVCWREANGVPHGEQYEKCVAVHAEANAIISAARKDLMGATMYLYGSENGKNCEVEPCLMCNRLLRNSGINVVFCASVDDLSNPVENPKKKWYC